MDRIHRNLTLSYFSLILALLAGCDRSIDINKLFPDARPQGGCRPGPDEELPKGACSKAPLREVSTCSDVTGEWTLIIPKEASHTSIGIQDKEVASQAAAEAIDWDDQHQGDVGFGEVAGFAISIAKKVPPSRTVMEQSAEIYRKLRASEAFKSVTLRSLGLPTTSHDGYPLVVGTELDIVAAAGSEAHLHEIRNRLYALLLDLDPAQLDSLPDIPDKRSVEFKLAYATLLRDERIIVTGGVATKENFSSTYSKAHFRVASLASGSLVGGLAARTRARCESTTFKQPLGGKVDLVWLVDGSDHYNCGVKCVHPDDDTSPTKTRWTRTAMYDIRNLFHGAASVLWKRMETLDLDLWQAVVGMDQHLAGQPCTSGTDPRYFWDQGGLSGFQSCLLWPSRVADPSELVLNTHGLASARESLLTVLPRAVKNPKLLRKGARTAVLFLSNQEDRDVYEAFCPRDAWPKDWPKTLPSCRLADPLSAGDQHKLVELKAFRELHTLLRKKPDAGASLAGTLAFALVADPAFKCGTFRGSGYAELTRRLGGMHDLICQDEESADDRLRQLVDDLAAEVSAITLRYDPASLTLNAALNGKRLFPSHTRGFDLARRRKALLLYGLSEELSASGNKLEVSYVGW